MSRHSGSRSDARLVRAYLKGDVGAFEELYERYENSLFGYIRGMVGEREEAEDIFQETFLKVSHALGSYRESGSFRSWLFTVAANLCRDHLRRRSRRSELDRQYSAGDRVAADPETTLEEKQAAERLSELVAGLPREQREVVILRTRAGLSFREIARLQGCPLGTALGRMHLAVKRLRKGFDVG